MFETSHINFHSKKHVKDPNNIEINEQIEVNGGLWGGQIKIST